MTASPSDPTNGDEAVAEEPASPEQGAADVAARQPEVEAGAVAETDEAGADAAAAAETAPKDQEEADLLAEFAAELAGALGASAWTADHGTVRVTVDRDQWRGAVAATAERLPFFSWLSAVDWSREVAVGDPPEAPDDLDERYEVLCRMSSVTDASGAILVTKVPKDDAWMPSVVDLIPGAGWHERETHEMFGLDFRGNPNLDHLYLPDSFEGHPLRKSYPLLSRQVKPWPGTVDVEGIPGTENVEAGDAADIDAEDPEDDEA